MDSALSPRKRRIVLAGALLLLLALLPSLLLGGAQRAFAGDPLQPAAAVSADLTAQGYEVQDVSGPDTEPGSDTATAIMTMASDSLDERATAQLQAGWVALGTYYTDVQYLRNGLVYEGRYILVWVIANSDWQAWLHGDLPSEDFWNHVQFAVFDTSTGKYIDSSRDFIDKNFNGNDLPGPNPAGDPSDAPGAPSSLLLDVSSLLVPADSAKGTTVLARLVDDESRRVPGQTVTFTVSTRNVGNFGTKTAATDDVGVARSSYIPAEGIKMDDGGVPVSISASGPGRINARTKLLIAPIVADDNDAAKELVTAALKGVGYDTLDFYLETQSGPTGETYVYGGPMMESKSVSVDAAFFQQAKAGIGTTLTAFPRMTQVISFQHLQVKRKQYWVVFSTVRSNWDAWVSGERTEAEFWAGVDITSFDSKFNPIDEKDFIDKDFGTGQDVPVQTSNTKVTYTASLVQEEWGPQTYYGEFNLPGTASMDGFSADLHDGATGWRIYELSNLAQPVFDSEAGDLAGLVLGPGNYFIRVVADEPPASVTVKATLHVRY